MFLLNVGQEGSLVVYAEGENAVLIRHFKASAVDCAVRGSRCRLQVETVEGREHGEFELKNVVFRYIERDVVVLIVFG